MQTTSPRLDYYLCILCMRWMNRCSFFVLSLIFDLLFIPASSGATLDLHHLHQAFFIATL